MKIELLSPAGSMESLVAAIEAGCDAVYLGGTLFGARAFANNFDDEEIVKAIKYCHLYGVKVYVTTNILIYEHEVERFLKYVEFLHKNNVDAIIMQDLGMLDLVHKTFPNLEIHASTQMHIHNYDGALFAKKMGIKRVVMARETPYELIKKIKKELSLEVEIFVHGALCVSYSGQCLMSALIGNRSGNRGTCAQVCRKMYDLYDENNNKLNTDKYLLSTKDLCLINDIDKLIKMGVDSLKIEGRMKRPEYVYLVVSVYRKAIDNYINNGSLNISEEDIINLKKMFNRNFTKGFIFNDGNNNYVYQKRPNHKGIDLGTIVEYKNNYLKIKLQHDLNLHDGLRIIDEKEDKGLVVNKMFINKKEVSSAKSDDIVSIKFDKFVKVGSNVVLTSDYKQLKQKWKVSMAAMIRRAYTLNIITADDYQMLVRTMQRRSIWKNEPLDDILITAEPSLLRTSVTMLLSEKVFTAKEFVDELSYNFGLSLYSEEIEHLLNLPENTLQVNRVLTFPKMMIRKNNDD